MSQLNVFGCIVPVTKTAETEFRINTVAYYKYLKSHNIPDVIIDRIKQYDSALVAEAIEFLSDASDQTGKACMMTINRGATVLTVDVTK